MMSRCWILRLTYCRPVMFMFPFPFPRLELSSRRVADGSVWQLGLSEFRLLSPFMVYLLT